MCKESIPIVEKANLIDTDYRGKVKDLICLSCKNGCISFEFVLNGKCEHYVNRMSLNEIKDEIQRQNINIRRLCKGYGLKYGVMQDMLKNKLALSFKYYHILEMRIVEDESMQKYIERFEVEDGER